MSDCDCSIDAESDKQRRVLRALLAINAAMFIAEFMAGVVAESAGLIADSLDMLADATVYAVSLYAVGRAASQKIRAASISGIFQVLLALGVAAEIVRRWVWGSEPESLFMIVVSAIALLANIVCLRLISRYRDGEVHMRASWIFSRNDVIANVGVILAGILVHALGSRLPDLIIAAAIVILVLQGGLTILAEARDERRRSVLDVDQGNFR